MRLLASTDKLQLVTDAACAVDVDASFVDSNADGTTITLRDPQLTAITTATTTDIVAAPAASTWRNVKEMHIRNKGASASVTVKPVVNRSAGTFEPYPAFLLLAGQSLEYIEHVGWYPLTQAARLDAKLRVAVDVVNATTSFADITGLTCAVLSGRQYNFEAHLIHKANATTSGAQFGINGPAMTEMRISSISVKTGNVGTGVISTQTADITALDTAAIIQIDSSVTSVLTILTGWFNPSADGTFAVRCKSEIAVAAGLTVQEGSWARVWESDS